MNDDLKQRKAALRRWARRARREQFDKDELSRAVIQKITASPRYQQARTVMWYVHSGHELRTHAGIEEAIGCRKRVVVPYCTEDARGQPRLGLWQLERLEELTVGKWRILEPPPTRWEETGKKVAPDELDLVIVPGLAFDRRGGRLGNGQGYYDRLLRQVRSDCFLVAPCYPCQLIDTLPVGSHDIFMHQVVAPRRVYPDD